MNNSFFFLQSNIENEKNTFLIDRLRDYAEHKKQQIYVVQSPLGDEKYKYDYKDALIILTPKHKIIFVDFGNDEEAIEEFRDDFIEDLGAISDKFRYRDHIGRPKAWKSLIEIADNADLEIDKLLERHRLADPKEQKTCELLISLVTGSINDIERVKGDVPEYLLDKVKQKIQLFDGEQTRFIYQKPTERKVVIQGLSGTGKTELLLHKLKEIYVSDSTSKVLFTCHNRILAASMRKRIPDFFNFMKVEQQIKWNERLWCIHAWGSWGAKHSGTYRYICDFYDIPFQVYSRTMTFERVCALALEAIEAIPESDFAHAFDYMLIDESQDFPDSFFDLCERVTKHAIYVAGDIFQSIFDSKIIDRIDPTYLLSKCYRTDPKTLMFAHALGMGLFESPKLRWLHDPEWGRCGYLFDKSQEGSRYTLWREPLRRFEDFEEEDGESARLIEIAGLQTFPNDAVGAIVSIIEEIRTENPTVKPDDIGVIFVDSGNDSYYMGDLLAAQVDEKFQWETNQAYSSKEKTPDMLFVSNTNNVKGLEFPFVICITNKISNLRNYRNALYMTMTRSFIRTYLIVSKPRNETILPLLRSGLHSINTTGKMIIDAPSKSEQATLSTTINVAEEKISLFDMCSEIFEELDVMPLCRGALIKMVTETFTDSYDYDGLKQFIKFNNDVLMKQRQ